jgi:hypothetical protein
MQEEMEMKGGSAVRLGPAENGPGAGSVAYRQKQQLEVRRTFCYRQQTLTNAEVSQLFLVTRVLCNAACLLGVRRRQFTGRAAQRGPGSYRLRHYY